jgi:HAD superfamily hydrolase (TIGR01509 family)
VTYTLIFDCDGVLADTERYGHLPAFNRTFEEFGLPVRWSAEEYARKVLIGGGKERMRSLLTPEFVAAAGLPAQPEGQDAAVAAWHRRKTEIYTSMVHNGQLPGRPGVRRVIAAAAGAGWRLAVASTSAEVSVRAVLGHVAGPELAAGFAVFAGDVVPAKKPAPDIYRLAVRELAADAGRTVVVEDSRNGLLAASGAGLPALITVNGYTAGEDFTGAALVVTSLGDPGEPARVIANRTAASPGDLVDLTDLVACIEAGPAVANGAPHGR